MSAYAVLTQARAKIRLGLKKHGTDVEKNDRDVVGDGDQSPINLNFAGKQFYRDLFAYGADFHECAAADSLTTFGKLCLLGDTSGVEAALKRVDDPSSAKPTPALITLLESRETSMRLSPLLMVVSMGKNSVPRGRDANLSQNQVRVFRLLLQYGARPDAKDVCGKTVCHYGAGVMATSMTLACVDMCIPAAESSYLFGEEVELFGLKSEAMNGLKGVGRGYHAATGRRAVYLYDKKNEVSVKPENIRLVGKSGPVVQTKLCDVQDRLGIVCLQELVMGTTHNGADVAKHMLEKHDPNVDVADFDGFSPKRLALAPGASMASNVASLVKDHIAMKTRAENRAERRQCALCKKPEKKSDQMDVCSQCKSVRYCSRDCQVSDWKKHKPACKELQAKKEKGMEGIVLERPLESGMHQMSINWKTGKQSGIAFKKPSSVAAGKTFFIKVQGNSDQAPLFIYDKSREFSIYYDVGLRGFRELLNTVEADKPSSGRKTYMKASFDADGNCTVYPGTATIKTW